MSHPVPKLEEWRTDVGVVVIENRWFLVTLIILTNHPMTPPRRAAPEIYMCGESVPPQSFIITHPADEVEVLDHYPFNSTYENLLMFLFTKINRPPPSWQHGAPVVKIEGMTPQYTLAIWLPLPHERWDLQIPKARDIVGYPFERFEFLAKQAPSDQYNKLIRSLQARPGDKLTLQCPQSVLLVERLYSGRVPYKYTNRLPLKAGHPNNGPDKENEPTAPETNEEGLTSTMTPNTQSQLVIRVVDDAEPTLISEVAQSMLGTELE